MVKQKVPALFTRLRDNLSYRAIVISGIIAFVAAFTNYYSTVFIPELIIWLGYKEHEKGFLTGVISTSYYLGKALCTPLWGRLSDKISRTKVLHILFWFSAGSCLTFSFSVNIYMAIATRFISGAVSCAMTITRAILHDVTDINNEKNAMSAVQMIRFSGVAIGQLVGGFLSNPVTKYPWLFEKNFVNQHYPFLIPSLIGFILSISLSALIFFAFPAFSKNRRGLGRSVPNEVASYKPQLHKSSVSEFSANNKIKLNSSTILEENLYHGAQAAIQSFDINTVKSCQNQICKLPSLPPILTRTCTCQNINEPAGIFCVYEQSSMQWHKIHTITTKYSAGNKHSNNMHHTVKPYPTCFSSLCLQATLFIQLINTRGVFHVIIVYSLYAFGSTGNVALTTAWMSLKRDLGGLDFTSDYISIYTSSACFLSVPALALYCKKYKKRFSNVRVFIVSAITLLVCQEIIPLSRFMKISPWLVLLPIGGVIMFTHCIALSTIYITINHSVPESHTGSINGLSDGTSSFFKSFAPLAIGSLLTWTTTSHVGPPIDSTFPFVIGSFLTWLSCVIAVFLPRLPNTWFAEEQVLAPPNEIIGK